MSLIENNFILCDELLLIILNYVGKYRNTVKLSCRKLYKLICDIEKNKFPLKVNNDNVSSLRKILLIAKN